MSITGNVVIALFLRGPKEGCAMKRTEKSKCVFVTASVGVGAFACLRRGQTYGRFAPMRWGA